MTSATPPPTDSEPPQITPLTEPADGIGPVIETPAAFAEVVGTFAAGTGPIAADAERASGYRYGQRTYLIQIRRTGAQTALIDPIALPDLSPLMTAVGDAEWILHAASQDLPGFRDHGLLPARIFDTELAARLLGLERVGLAAVVADALGLGLAKEHSAVDWSTRPLPIDWLRYAALDVEVLIPLRGVLGDRLAAAGKETWASQEFDAIRTAPPAPPRPDPWRRTSGTHSIRDTRSLAIVRSLWQARDANARHRDIAPGRVLPDRAIIAAALARPTSVAQLIALPEFAGKGTRRRAPMWQQAIDAALALPASALPDARGPRTDSPPPPRAWADRNPVGLARLEAARAFMAAESQRLSVPVENLLTPDTLRRLCWSPPTSPDAAAVGDALAARGARPWQIELLAEPLASVITQTAADPLR